MPKSTRKEAPRKAPNKSPLQRKNETTRDTVYRNIHEIRLRVTDENLKEDLDTTAWLLDEEFNVLEEITWDNSKEVILEASTKLHGSNMRIIELDSIIAEAEFDTFLEEFQKRHLIKIYND